MLRQGFCRCTILGMKLSAVMLSSESPRELGKFYRDVVGLKMNSEEEWSETEYGMDLDLGNGVSMYVSSHSEVKGKNENPSRFILNIEAEDIDVQTEEIKERGAKLVKEPYDIEGFGRIATFEDLDGNYFQLIKLFL